MLLLNYIYKLFGEFTLLAFDQKDWTGFSFIILRNLKFSEYLIANLQTYKHVLVDYEAYNLEALKFAWKHQLIFFINFWRLFIVY